MNKKQNTALLLVNKEKKGTETKKENLMKRYVELLKQKDNYSHVEHISISEETDTNQILSQIEEQIVLIQPFYLEWNEENRLIIPEEFGFEGRRAQISGKEVVYCKPIGYDDFLLEPLQKRAKRSLKF